MLQVVNVVYIKPCGNIHVLVANWQEIVSEKASPFLCTVHR